MNFELMAEFGTFNHLVPFIVLPDSCVMQNSLSFYYLFPSPVSCSTTLITMILSMTPEKNMCSLGLVCSLGAHALNL